MDYETNNLADSLYSDPLFKAMSDRGRREVYLRCEAVDRISRAPRKGEALAEEAKKLKFGQSTIRLWREKYARFGWRGLVDKRKEPHWDQRVPEAFLLFWEHLCELRNGNIRETHKLLCDLYRSRRVHSKSVKWGAIKLWPGYKSRPKPSKGTTGLPRGWGYANLARLTKLRKERRSVMLGAPITIFDVSQTKGFIRRIDSIVAEIDLLNSKIAQLRADILKGTVRP